MKTKLGIVGCGFLGNIVADAWKKGLLPDYELVGVTSRTRASAEKTAANVGCAVCEDVVLASLLLGAFSPLSAFLMALMIQARHLFYGLAMLERYKGYGLRSFYMIFAMSDETFSITCSAEPPEGVDKGWFMFFITLLDQFYWVASAGLGAAVGSILPFSTEGVDFVMTAMFTVIFLNQWEKDKQHYSALIGIAVPLVCLAVFGSGSFLLPAMACILVLLLALRKPIEKAEGTEADKRKEETGV